MGQIINAEVAAPSFNSDRTRAYEYFVATFNTRPTLTAKASVTPAHHPIMLRTPPDLLNELDLPCGAPMENLMMTMKSEAISPPRFPHRVGAWVSGDR